MPRKRPLNDTPVMPSKWTDEPDDEGDFGPFMFVLDDPESIARDIKVAFPHLSPDRFREWREDEWQPEDD
jgi:hypothetical protein